MITSAVFIKYAKDKNFDNVSYNTQSSAKRRTYDVILSGRSLTKIRKRTGPKTDHLGHKVGPGLDLRLGHPTPLFESAQRDMS